MQTPSQLAARPRTLGGGALLQERDVQLVLQLRLPHTAHELGVVQRRRLRVRKQRLVHVAILWDVTRERRDKRETERDRETDTHTEKEEERVSGTE